MNNIISLIDLLVIYNHPSHLVAVLTLEGKFERVNASVATLLGFWEENLLGKQISNIIHPDDHPNDIMAFYKDGSNDYTCTGIKRTRSSDGSYRNFSWCFTKLAGRPFIYAIAHDCTDKIEVSPSYSASKNNEKSEMLSSDKNIIGESGRKMLYDQLNCLKNIAWKQSHLMRSPLTNLKSLVILLKEDPANHAYIEHLRSELEKLDKVIKEMVYETSVVAALNF